MRYVEVDNIEYTNADGKVHTIKDRRQIPDYNILTSIRKSKEELGDEVATRSEIYGELAEDLTYRIYEANILALIEARLDFEKLRTIKIPSLEDV